MLRPPLVTPLQGGVLGGGNIDIVVTSETRHPGHIIDYWAWIT